MQQGVTEFHKITDPVQINFTLSVLTQFWELKVHQKIPSFNPDLLALSPLQNYHLLYVSV